MDINTERLLNRFIQYVKTDTQSNQQKADEGIMPSTQTQLIFAQQLADELRTLSIQQVTITEFGYVYAFLPATKNFENAPTIAFSAHMDTSDAVCGTHVNPIITKKDNDTIITSDGTTLLGADDKAGIAEIITAIQEIILQKIPHGNIEILFSPDEETGHGMDNVPLNLLKSKICYTLDGGEEGIIESECFNAYKATIHFFGIPKHTGTARPDMVNATTMAAAFISLLPQNESPESTDGHYGFYAPMNIEGIIEKATVTVFLRDFETAGMDERIDSLKILAKAIETRFKGGKVQIQFDEQYRNMKENLQKKPIVLEKLVQAVKNAGLEPKFNPIRGGTDGSRLTQLGILTPNIFTGGHNFHSLTEWASINQMKKSVQTIIELILLWKEET